MLREDKIYIGADSETPAMGAGNVACKVICVSAYSGENKTLIGNDDQEALHDFCKMLLGTDYILIYHNAAFDLVRMMVTFPDLVPDVFAKIHRGEVHDTLPREKLLHLTDHGDMEFRPMPGGGKRRIGLALSDLVLEHFNVNITESKKGDDAWRLRYGELDGVPATEYPQEAWDYAVDDAVWAYHLFHHQNGRAALLLEEGIDPFIVESHLIRVGVGLELATCYGKCVDPEKVREVQALMDRELSPEHINLLRSAFALRLSTFAAGRLTSDECVLLHRIAENRAEIPDLKSAIKEVVEDKLPEEDISKLGRKIKDLKGDILTGGILRPAIPPMPYAKGTKEHQVTCRGHKDNPEYSKKRVDDCDCPVKMKKAENEKRNTKVLHQYVTDLCKRDSFFKLRWTKKSAKFPDGQVQVDKDWMEEFAAYDPVMFQYQHRQKLQKIVTDYLNKLVDAETGEPIPRIHASFDSLKSTGRSSSFASKAYPSWNGQNVDPRIRPVIIPTYDDHLLFSSDVRAMELCTFAQNAINLFGHSQMAEVINSGKDAHAFLGARLAYELDTGFKAYAEHEDFSCQDDLYELFYALKKDPSEEVRALYKKYRTFAKPTNLGYPGGLGPKTMIGIAKTQFGLDLTLEMAKMFQRFWKEVFPEAPLYLDHINRNCKDPRNQGRIYVDDKGKERILELYRYTTPMGMLRSGAKYCACANGMGLQSFSAEGALNGFYRTMRCCYDETMNSSMFGHVYPSLFIHDEVFGEIKNDDRLQENIIEIENVFTSGLQELCPDVTISAETALMERWDKAADPVFDENKNLLIWRPKV